MRQRKRKVVESVLIGVSCVQKVKKFSGDFGPDNFGLPYSEKGYF